MIRTNRLAVLVSFPVLLALSASPAEDNALSEKEKNEGWILLFDGKTLNGWMTSGGKPSKVPVEDHSINPHGCGDYMMVYQKPVGDFILSLDFMISKSCNSGIFIRTSSLTPMPGKDVGFNGIEVAIDDTRTAGFVDTGALYDLVKPKSNAMKRSADGDAAGQWNHAVIACERNLISVELNGELVTKMDLDEWMEKGKRPDGSRHKFDDTAYRDHPRKGYLGLQDHGSNCWFKNIKLKPLGKEKV